MGVDWAWVRISGSSLADPLVLARTPRDLAAARSANPDATVLALEDAGLLADCPDLEGARLAAKIAGKFEGRLEKPGA